MKSLMVAVGMMVCVLAGCGGAPFTEAVPSGGASEDAPFSNADSLPDIPATDAMSPSAESSTDDASTSMGDGGLGTEHTEAGTSSSSSGGSSTGSSSSSSGGHVDASSSGGSSGGGSSGSSGGSSSSSSGGSVCASGAVRCSGLQPQTCVGGTWLGNGAACSAACLGGACVACVPGSHSCASATQPQTCSASGSWVPSATCSGATPLCSNGSCSAICCQFAGGTAAISCDYADAGAAWLCTGAQTYSCTQQGNCNPGMTCYGNGLYGGTVVACP